MKKLISLVLALVLAASLLVACSSGSASKSLTIAVPNDTTNEARALLLLEANGLIKLKAGAGIAATKLDIVEQNTPINGPITSIPIIIPPHIF